MGFSRFISDDEEDEYARGLGEEYPENKDWAWLVSGMRKPEQVIAPAPTDPRMEGRGSGSGIDMFASTRAASGGDAPEGEGDTGAVSPTAKRLMLAQQMDDDPDADYETLTPDMAMLSDTDTTKPGKPPGPDSPSTQYKDPAGSFLEAAGHTARKRAYDQDWDASGKWKGGFKIETTQQRMARREMQQRDVMEAEESGLRMFDRSRDEERRTRVRPSGQAMRMTGDQGDGIYQGYSDGTFKKVGGVLDKDADQEGKYGETIFYDAQGRAMVKEKGSYRSRYLEDPNAGLPLADTVNGGSALHGPTDPYVDRWVAPQKEQTRVLGRGSTWLDEDGNVIGRGQPVPPSTDGGGGAAAAKDPAAQARKEAGEEADKILKGNKEYERASPEARDAERNRWINKILERNKSGNGAAPAKPKRTVVVG